MGLCWTPDEALSPCLALRNACRFRLGEVAEDIGRRLEVVEDCQKCLAREMAQRTYKMSANLKSGGRRIRRQSRRVKVVGIPASLGL